MNGDSKRQEEMEEYFPTHFANHMAISHNEHEFFITYYHMVPTLNPNGPAGSKEAKMTLVTPVARLAIPAT